ncbi:MAG: PepSY domain-containing protein [Albidovulum sp.]|uniref:PepSY-associated TM helix domain-containing protein n=1 Tax=Albidovulum sp. TaxID=1872424 RepID=UPI001321FBA2|nr:PepSY-associated TM helix domain-containing protein [Defluviimonas sp.]KAB2884348.1 MAG: PepSY domain-containing protein [Defluviimonas sp.]
MTQRRFRSIVFKLHAWLGLHVFAVMALLFLTGTVLVFVYQIEAALIGSERLQEPRPMEERSSFGTLYDTTRAYAPDAVVVEITRSESPWIADRARIFVKGGGFRYIWFGGAGESVSREASTTDLQRVVHDIHASFLTGHMAGGIAVGVFSILLGGFVISGLISYRRFWRGFLRLPPRHLGPRAWWGGLHRLLALWLMPFLLIMCVTGTFYLVTTLGLLNFQGLSATGLAERESRLPEGFDGQALDRAVAAAEAAAPGVTFYLVRLPGAKKQGIEFYGRDDTPLTDTQANRLLIDPSNLAVLDNIRAADMSATNRVTQWNDSLHHGTWGGFPTELLWALFGLMATALSVAGAMVYASRVAQPDDSRSAIRRIWSGTVLVKFGYPLFVMALVAIGLLRFA